MKKSILLIAAVFSFAVMVTSCKEAKKEGVKTEKKEKHPKKKKGAMKGACCDSIKNSCDSIPANKAKDSISCVSKKAECKDKKASCSTSKSCDSIKSSCETTVSCDSIKSSCDSKKSSCSSRPDKKMSENCTK